MSNDQLVQLPANVLTGSQKFEVINLLGTIARFALPGTFPGNAVERDLEARYAELQAIGLPEAVAWLSQAGIKLTPLDNAVASLQGNGDAEPLHSALQSGNNVQSLQLLAVNDASKLVELEDRGEPTLSPYPLAIQPQPCLLLRLGYNTDQSYAYYAASLPGDSRRPIKLTWDSVVAAGVAAAVAIPHPPKPVDLERAKNSMQIMTAALVTATQAHADVMDALGQPLPDAMQPAPAQAV